MTVVSISGRNCATTAALASSVKLIAIVHDEFSDLCRQQRLQKQSLQQSKDSVQQKKSHSTTKPPVGSSGVKSQGLFKQMLASVSPFKSSTSTKSANTTCKRQTTNQQQHRQQETNDQDKLSSSQTETKTQQQADSHKSSAILDLVTETTNTTTLSNNQLATPVSKHEQNGRTFFKPMYPQRKKLSKHNNKQSYHQFCPNSNQVIEFKFDLIVNAAPSNGNNTNNDGTTSNHTYQPPKITEPSIASSIESLAKLFLNYHNDSCILTVDTSRRSLRKTATNVENHVERKINDISSYAEVVLKTIFTSLKETEHNVKNEITLDNISGEKNQKSFVEIKAALFLSCSKSTFPRSNECNSASCEDLRPINCNLNAFDLTKLKSFQIIDLVAGKRILEDNCYSNNNSNGDTKAVDIDSLEFVHCASLDSALSNLDIIKQRYSGICDSEVAVGGKDSTTLRSLSIFPDSCNAANCCCCSRRRLLDPSEASDCVTGSEQGSSSLLILIGLTLKQHINGGLFASRFTFLNLDSKCDIFKPILVALFDGSAVSTLKAHEMHLQHFHSSSSNSLASGVRKANTNIKNDDVDSHFINDNDSCSQAHSFRKFIHAEWILFKQLSSVLMQTLLVANVHKVDLNNHCVHTASYNDGCNDCPGENDVGGAHSENSNESCCKRTLIDENYQLLDLVTSIKEASIWRHERRKRHLKSNVKCTTLLNNSLATPVRLHSRVGLLQQKRRRLPQVFATSGTQSTDYDDSADDYNNFLSNYNINANSYSNIRATQRRSLSRSTIMHHHRRRNNNKCCNHNTLARDEIESNYARTEAHLPFKHCSSADRSRNRNSCRRGSCGCFDQRASVESSYVTLRYAARKLHKNRSNVCMNSQSLRSSSSSLKSTLSSRHSTKLYEDSSAAESTSRLPSIKTTNGSVGVAKKKSSSSKSCIIELDCKPPLTHTTSSGLTHQTVDWSLEIAGGEREEACNNLEHKNDACIGDIADDISDIASVIAEPPKQLKLEEYLSQLNGSIKNDETSADSNFNLTANDNQSSTKQKMDLTDLVANIMRHKQAMDSTSKDEQRFCVKNKVVIDTDCYGFSRVRKSQAAACIKSSDGLLHTPSHLSSKDGYHSSQQYNCNCSVNVDSNDDDDEFDDCKSHSSVLEKLSSLTFDSKSKNDRLDSFTRVVAGSILPTNDRIELKLANCRQNSGTQLAHTKSVNCSSSFFEPLSTTTNSNFCAKKLSLTHEEHEILSHAPNGIPLSDSLGAFSTTNKRTATSSPSSSAISATMKFGHARSSAESSLESGDSGAVSQSSSVSLSSASGGGRTTSHLTSHQFIKQTKQQMI